MCRKYLKCTPVRIYNGLVILVLTGSLLAAAVACIVIQCWFILAFLVISVLIAGVGFWTECEGKDEKCSDIRR